MSANVEVDATQFVPSALKIDPVEVAVVGKVAIDQARPVAAPELTYNIWPFVVPTARRALTLENV